MAQVRAGMTLGNNVTITPGVRFDPPHSFLTSIGNNCIIAPDVRFINHDASLYGFTHFARLGTITILENCFIGAGSILLPSIIIGPNAIIAAGSVVTRDVPPDSVVAGNPAKFIKTLKEYIDENTFNKNSSKYPSFDSNTFYPNLHDKHFLTTIKDTMKNGIAFSVGSDGDTHFLFNPKTSNPEA